MLYQTRHWKPIVNGYSSFATETFSERGARLNSFPAPEAIEESEKIGVSHVMLEHATLEPEYGRDAFIDAARPSRFGVRGGSGWLGGVSASLKRCQGAKVLRCWCECAGAKVP